MSTPVYNVLFLCTANSARSVMSEGLLNVMGNGRFRCFSAGSQPSGRVNPHAIAMLDTIGYDTAQLRSKSWDEFGGEEAPQMDLIITVCGNAKNEVCPFWPGHPTTAHWGYEDPHGDNEAALRASFEKIFAQIQRRTAYLMSLGEDALSPENIQETVRMVAEFDVEAA